METPIRSVLSRVRDRLFATGRIGATGALTARMRHLVIEGPQLVDLPWTPGQQVRVHVLDLLSPTTWTRLGEALRTYSVWDYDAGRGRMELAVLDHGGDTPGARWARQAGVGDEVVLGRPEGTLVAREGAAFHVFAAEETGAVASGAILRALPEDARVFGAFEAATAEDHVPLPRQAELCRVNRGDAPAADSAVLARAVRGLDLPRGDGHGGVAYLTGEARTIQSIRRYLVGELGWDRRAVLTKPFWTPGKRGME